MYVIVLGKILTLEPLKGDGHRLTIETYDYSRIKKSRVRSVVNGICGWGLFESRIVGDRGQFRGRWLTLGSKSWIEIDDFQFPPKGDDPEEGAARAKKGKSVDAMGHLTEFDDDDEIVF
jgi:hypothetical protein